MAGRASRRARARRSSIRAGTCRRAAAAAATNISPPTSPARASSTSTRSATARIPRRTCCRAPHEFGAAMEQLGIGRDDRIVVYDNSPMRTAARGWFMLRHFGARRGRDPRRRLPEMARRRPPDRKRRAGAARRPVRRAESARRGRHQGSRSSPALGCALLDARGKGRFEGERARAAPGRRRRATSRARATCRSAALYDEDGTFKPADEIARLFAEAGVDPAQPFVASCGSGVTANSLIFAAHLLGGDGRQALRRQLERMGRRSGDPEGGRAGLGEDDPGDVLQARGGFRRPAPRLAAAMRLAARPGARSAALRCPRRSRRPVAPSGGRSGAAWLRRHRPTPPAMRFVIGEVDAGPAAERLDQPQRVANARQPRHRLGIGQRRVGSSRQAGLRQAR